MCSQYEQPKGHSGMAPEKVCRFARKILMVHFVKRFTERSGQEDFEYLTQKMQFPAYWAMYITTKICCKCT